MAAKFEFEKFNGNNFSLWKLKMKAILTKDKCLAAIGERSSKVTDDTKWDKMNGNAIPNLHLALLHNKKILKRKLYALCMPESTSVTEHVNNLNTLFSKLTSLSCKIEPQERAEILLQSFPDSYDQVIINLTSNVLADYLVSDDVAVAILEEENRRNNMEDMQTSSRHVESLVVTRGRSMEPGSSGSHNHEDGNALCCEAAVANESRKRFVDVWLFDTTTTFHMTARREWFHQYKPISGGGSVYSCNDHEVKIIGIGSIMVKMHDGTVRTIRDVRHVEGLKKNLLSLGQLDDLGHMSEQGMKILVERKLLPGLTKVSLPFSEHCVISKQHRLKFKTSNSRSVFVLELVHSDVWQAPVQSLGGAKYFVSFVDDYSRICWVYPIKKKSNVFEVFKVYKAWVELDSRKKIKCLRTNNGGEYTGDEFDTFCRQEGIKRQFTTSYTPQQNGVAERMNMTLVRKSKSNVGNCKLRKIILGGSS
ncbi:gag-pol polyprotein [Tanacetum coccineum]